MAKEQQRYHSYLLRLWQVGNQSNPQWRISLEDVQTHERRGFTELEQLSSFLAAYLRNNWQPQVFLDPDRTEQE